MNLFIFYVGLLFHGLSSCVAVKKNETEKIVHKIVANAGKNVSLVCSGIDEKTQIETLTWKTTKTIIKYVNGKPLDQNQRRFLNPKNFSLEFNPVKLSDSAEYICLFNERNNPTVVIDLLIQDIPEMPARPLIITFTSRSVNLSWAQSHDPKNAPVTDFIIETRVGESGNWDEVHQQIHTNSSNTSFQMTDLLPFTVYSFRIRAVNSLGFSLPSKESYYIVTLREVPIGKPVTTIAHNTSSNSIYVSWKPPPLDTIFGEFLGYRITYRARDLKPEKVNEIFIRDSSVESHEIHDLEIFTQYLVSIQVFNPEGLGPTTSVVVMTDEGVPSKPRNVTVHEVTSTTIKISWLEPEKPNGGILTYRVYYTFLNQTLLSMPKNDPANGLKSESGMHFYTLTSLMPFTEYRIIVIAITIKHDGNASTPIIQRTDVAGPTAPFVVNLTCFSYDGIYLRWKRPSNYYNSIDFYIISFKPVQHEVFEQFQINATAAHLETALTIPNLTTNTVYEVKVQASSLSIINSRKLVLGANSAPKRIALKTDCDKVQSLLQKGIDNDHNMALLTAIALCSCFGLMLILAAVVAWRKCFYAAYYYLDDPPNQPQTANVDWEAPTLICGEKREAVHVEEFTKHVAHLHADGDIGFSREYELIQNESITDEHASEHSQHPDNKAKNRYLNIIAYDHSRVHLRPAPGQKKGVDYINANYIDGYHKSRAFIGTQGPLPGTFDCFWRMIWEQRVAIIVMITNLVERGRRKCDMYWPKEGIETYGVIQVKLIKEEVMATYTVRTFQIRHLKLKKKKQISSEKLVYQYHYTNWPDHGTPDHPLPVLNFVKKSSFANPPEAGPIVVHCSAGVGRTGTYIVLDAMLKQIQHKNIMNVFGFLRHIRSQRNFLVQTEEQYIFLHDALVEAIVSCETNIGINTIAMLANDDEFLCDQFKLITSFQPKEIHMTSAQKQVNSVKNRSTIIPLEGSRAHLTPKPGVDGSDYINASWLFGFRRLRDFIVTQHPLSNTIKDFWQMILDHSVQTIVLLSTVDEVSFLQFWPNENETIENEYYRVEMAPDDSMDDEQFDYVIKRFRIQSIQDDYEMEVRMLYNPSWPNLNNTTSLYDFLIKMHERQDSYKNGPIVVVDRYGGSHAATLCEVSSLAMQLEYDNTANIYTYAKLYHNKRPNVWTSHDNISLIYKILAAFPKGFSLLKHTALRTEFDDMAMTTATPDLYSKICSNGSISNHLHSNGNGNGNGNSVIVKMKNSDNDNELSVVVTTNDNGDNLMLSK